MPTIIINGEKQTDVKSVTVNNATRTATVERKDGEVNRRPFRSFHHGQDTLTLNW
jgi:hypothetical protein